MNRLALSVLLIGAMVAAVAQDRKKPRPLTEREVQLKAVSPRLLEQYWTTVGQINRWCPKTGGAWSDVRIPAEAMKDRFYREIEVVCESAHAALPVFARFASPAPPTPELFTFSAYLRDYSNIDIERYLRHEFGPFGSKSDCEAQERSFQGAGIGTLSCATWVYK